MGPAVHDILVERCDEDLCKHFRRRGRSQKPLVAALRTKHTTDLDADKAETTEAESAVPLTDFKTNLKLPVTDLPVLKRLGQPAFLPADLLAVRGPAYRKRGEPAIAAAFTETTATSDDTPDADE
jgi:hypothetical protein